MVRRPGFSPLPLVLVVLVDRGFFLVVGVVVIVVVGVALGQVTVGMFVIVLEYLKPLEEVDRWLDGHKSFLQEQYASKRFIASGPLLPRTGGVILARGCGRAELDTILGRDPFQREGVARYTVMEFEPNMFDHDMAPLLK